MNLEQLKQTDVKTVDLDTLVDIRDVAIDETLPADQRMKSYITQIKNPYCFRYGNTVVKLSFTENGGTLQEKLENILKKY